MQPTIHNFDELLAFASGLTPSKVGVVFPNNEETFEAISDAQKLLRASLVLFGQTTVIREGLAKFAVDWTGIEMVEASVVSDALAAAVHWAADCRVDILMKGGVDTSTMMKAVLAAGGHDEDNSGLRTGRLLSDIFVFEYPRRVENKLVMITDGGMTLAPNLKNKIELIRNAVEVAHALGNFDPKVAVLSATEFVLPDLQSTIDAAALSKMNERGQIQGCIVDGPLALDNALSEDAAREKGIKSKVAGKAEILIASNIESANSLAKSTTYFADLRLAHIIVGARVPILIPSRADRSDAKLMSVALGSVVTRHALPASSATLS